MAHFAKIGLILLNVIVQNSVKHTYFWKFLDVATIQECPLLVPVQDAKEKLLAESSNLLYKVFSWYEVWAMKNSTEKIFSIKKQNQMDFVQECG